MSPNSNARIVSIPIPPEAEPGDTLFFEIDGTQLELVVPDGCQPGDVLQVQLAETSAADTFDSLQQSDENKNSIRIPSSEDETSRVTTIHLSSGKDLFLFASSKEGSNDEADLSGPCDGTHAMVWHSGSWLMECLTSLDPDWRELLRQEFVDSLSSHVGDSNEDVLRVLELGSGLGGVGMVFGSEILGKILIPSQQPTTIFSQPTSSSSSSSSSCSIQLFLTDMPVAMPLLQHNLQQNLHVFQTHVHVSARSLTWTMVPQDDDDDDVNNSNSEHSKTAASLPTKTPCFDWIIGSDLLYNTQSIPALVNTMGRLLHPTRGRVLLAVRWRKPDMERIFFRQTTERFHWQWELLVPPASGNGIISTMCPLNWQDFGNAACDRSNQYFQSTCIAVHSSTNSHGNSSNSIKALCDISTDHVRTMSDEEFQAWERAHIQFYLARPERNSSPTST